jgi:hypothetical protein
MNKQKELLDYEHELKMKEIEARKQADIYIEKLKFDYPCQLQRIRNASIEKNILRKEGVMK